MKVFVDTNILLVSVSATSQYYPVFRALTSGMHQWVLSNEILLEYKEKLEERLSVQTAIFVEDLLRRAPYVQHVEPDYQWRLIKDEDDNKFADAYVAADADYLVTEDRHFDVLEGVPWPKINVIRFREFIQLIVLE